MFNERHVSLFLALSAGLASKFPNNAIKSKKSLF
jgi:hypothetical protein